MACHGDGWLEREDEDGTLLSERCPGCESCAVSLEGPELLRLLEAIEDLSVPAAQEVVREVVPSLIQELVSLRAQHDDVAEPNPRYVSPHPVIHQ